MTDNTQISEEVNRLEEIIDTLEDGEVSLSRAQELHEEGQSVLEELQSELELGDGDLIEE